MTTCSMELKHHMPLAGSWQACLCLENNSRLTQCQRLSWERLPWLIKALFSLCGLVEIHFDSCQHLYPILAGMSTASEFLFCNGLISTHEESLTKNSPGLCGWKICVPRGVTREVIPSACCCFKDAETGAEARDSSWYVQFTKHFYIPCPL